MNESQEQKLKLLRAKYTQKEDRSVIDDMERELQKLVESHKMAQHPVFIAIAKDAENKLNGINAVLMNDATLSELDRLALFKQKEVWKFVLQRFGVEYSDTAIRALESSIDAHLAR